MSKKIMASPRKGEKVEVIAEAVGLVRVAKISGPQGSRLVIVMNLEDDKLASNPKQ